MKGIIDNSPLKQQADFLIPLKYKRIKCVQAKKEHKTTIFSMRHAVVWIKIREILPKRPAAGFWEKIWYYREFFYLRKVNQTQPNMNVRITLHRHERHMNTPFSRLSNHIYN